MSEGLIYKILAGTYFISLNGERLQAKAAGRFRKEGLEPKVGDRVLLRPPQGGFWLIERIKERKNEFIRPPVANIDRLVIVFSPVYPAPDLSLADLLISYCRNFDIKPVICINKTDMDKQGAGALREQYASSGIDAVCVSAVHDWGMDELRSLLGRGISCFAGQSAVGKSSLLNRLIEGAELKTGALSRKTDRGRHTTRQCELMEYAPECFFVDTPGFSLLEQLLMPPKDFKALYYEFDKYAPFCRFRGCSHVNEPGCAVKEAVARGELSSERYERYKSLYKITEENWRKRYD